MSRAPDFAPFLEERMQQLNLYPAKLAKALGVSNMAVLNWLRGTQPKPPLLPKLAAALDVDERTVTRLAGYPVREEAGDDSADGLRIDATAFRTLVRDLREWHAQGAALLQRLDLLVSRG